jgi:hypothetical protein
VSIKESIEVQVDTACIAVSDAGFVLRCVLTTVLQGHDSTIGLASRCAQFAEKDSAVVQAIKQAGGVPFCRTNIPQTNLSYGCRCPPRFDTTDASVRKVCTRKKGLFGQCWCDVHNRHAIVHLPWIITTESQRYICSQSPSHARSNPIFGSTVNPYNPLRTSGGSSGGEAALVACSGSIIGTPSCFPV